MTTNLWTEFLKIPDEDLSHLNPFHIVKTNNDITSKSKKGHLTEKNDDL